MDAYGVRREDVPGYSGMPNRSIFIIDRQGVVRWTWVRSQEEPFPNYDQVVTAAYGQPRPQAASNLRNYFTSHPNEYYDLRGILSPISDTELRIVRTEPSGKRRELVWPSGWPHQGSHART